MKGERAARLFVIGLLLGLPLAVFLARWFPQGNAPGQTVEIHARMPEMGGWSPADLTARVGEPLRLRLTSDDVLHSFAIGKDGSPPLDLQPGEMVETTLTFDRPGKYVFYCTRWCGAGHWRMRGTIEVLGETGEVQGDQSPLYASLGIDIDAPHLASVVPTRRPSASRGAALQVDIPARFLTMEYLRSHSPADAWEDLRVQLYTQSLDDEQVWDLVALVWKLSTSQKNIAAGAQLYAQNCAACHGESGSGDGVMASKVESGDHSSPQFGHELQTPADFTEATSMLGASSALLQGKLIRGGMGTGMPYFGPILTEEQTWALIDYLWTFQFDME